MDAATPQSRPEWPARNGRLSSPARMLVRTASAASSVMLLMGTTSQSAHADSQPTIRTTLFAHSSDSRLWISGQVNVIAQAHGAFAAPYSGVNSLSPHAESATSFVATLHAGLQPTHSTALLVDVESAGGRGISDALGLAGFTNLDVVRNPTLGATPYVARAEVHQVFSLSHETVAAIRSPLAMFESLPARRIEVRAGKLSTVDCFDLNESGSDSHLQFMNWTVDNNGAFDYAADTRGYTLGGIADYEDRSWGARFGELLMPTVANGIDYDFDLRHARGENLEIECRRGPFGRPGTVRLLGFLNHARMGSYAEAIDAYRAGRDSTPDITAHRAPGRTKGGIGLNFEQEVTDQSTLFGRWGWNDGHNESFAYTEVDDTFEAGVDVRGKRWHRRADKFGLALVSNGLSSGHRTYLELGGQGFLLGDGALRYGRETILESYYTAYLGAGVSPAVDLQWVQNPGYNRDRGPVLVASARLHFEL
jgi:hypothetical protein